MFKVGMEKYNNILVCQTELKEDLWLFSTTSTAWKIFNANTNVKKNNHLISILSPLTVIHKVDPFIKLCVSIRLVQSNKK